MTCSCLPVYGFIRAIHPTAPLLVLDLGKVRTYSIDNIGGAGQKPSDMRTRIQSTLQYFERGSVINTAGHG
jgi:hypothetical protein